MGHHQECALLPSTLLVCFLCSISFQPSHSQSVSVLDDRALLRALRDNGTVDIVLGTNITLGASWAFVQPPIKILRNVTIRSAPGSVMSLDLTFYTGLINLTNNVQLSFGNLTMLHRRRLSSLTPGLDIVVASGSVGASVMLNDVLLQQLCCLPAPQWNTYLAKLGAQGRTPDDMTFGAQQTNPECLGNSSGSFCWGDSVTFTYVTTPVYTAASSTAPDYYSNWRGVTFLCQSTASPSCLAVKDVGTCLEQCTADQEGYGIQPPIPLAPPGQSSLPPLPSQASAPPVQSSLSSPPSQASALPSNTPPVVASGIPAPATIDIESWLAPTIVGATVTVIALVLFLWWRRGKRLQHQLKDKEGPEGSGGQGLGPHSDAKGVPSLSPRSDSLVLVVRTCDAVLVSQPALLGGCLTSELMASCPAGPVQSSERDIFRSAGLRSTRLSSAPGSKPSHLLNHEPKLSSLGPKPRAEDDGTHMEVPRRSNDPVVAVFNAAVALAGIAARGRVGHKSGSSGSSVPQNGGYPSASTAVQRVQLLADELLVASEDEKLVVGRVIGRGAFGTVHCARWRNLDVAVKTVLFSQEDIARQEKAIVEAALASSVVHPNVVSVYHYDIKPVTSTETHGVLSSLYIEDRETPRDWKMYLVQELCQTSLSESLAQCVFHEQSGTPRMDLVLATLADVCRGCVYIHSKNILWGDLKPENVLLKMDPAMAHGIIAKITDFGMSTTIDPKRSHVSNFNKGTIGFSAPEVINCHHVSKASDVFSFGVLMQQMVKRTAPWSYSAKGTLEADQLFWRPVAGVPEQFVDMQRRCLAHDPKTRPSFGQVLRCLEAAYEVCMDGMNAALAAKMTETSEAASTSPSGRRTSRSAQPAARSEPQQQQQRSAFTAEHAADGADETRGEGRCIMDKFEPVRAQHWPHLAVMSESGLQDMKGRSQLLTKVADDTRVSPLEYVSMPQAADQAEDPETEMLDYRRWTNPM